MYKSSVVPTQSNHFVTRVQFLIRENKLVQKKNKNPQSERLEGSERQLLLIVGLLVGRKLGL